MPPWSSNTTSSLLSSCKCERRSTVDLTPHHDGNASSLSGTRRNCKVPYPLSMRGVSMYLWQVEPGKLKCIYGVARLFMQPLDEATQTYSNTYTEGSMLSAHASCFKVLVKFVDQSICTSAFLQRIRQQPKPASRVSSMFQRI